VAISHPVVKLLFLISSLLFATRCFGQDLVSTYKPKTQLEKQVLAKLKSMPEIKDLYACHSGKDYKFDIMIDQPDSKEKNYRFQVGTDHSDRFATNYWLSIDPPNLQVYYIDFDDEGMQDIPLQQWRYWRRRPEFQKLHKWANGKLVVLEEEKHVKKRSSKN
jgi:hypothetical protein